MVASNDIDLMVNSIAVVMENVLSEQPISLSPDALSNVLRRPLNVGEGSGGQIIVSSARDQVEVLLFPNKVDVRDISGVFSQGVTKVSRVIQEFLALLGNPKLRSYGINFIMEINKNEPEEWLGANLLAPALEEKLGTMPMSNHVSMVLTRLPKMQNIQLRSQSDDRINVNFNASVEAESLPDVASLTKDMKEQYQELNDFLKNLGII